MLMPSFEDKIKKHMPEVKTITIGNAISQFNFAADLENDNKQHKIIFVGRLNKNHKRPHLLIKAFVEVADKYLIGFWSCGGRKIGLIIIMK